MRKNQLVFFIFICLFSVFFLLSSTVAVVDDIGVIIDDGQSSTKSHYVDLDIIPPTGARYMRIDDEENFSGAAWQSVRKSVRFWELPFGNGQKTIYIQFKDRLGRKTQVYSDSIRMDARSNIAVEVKINDDDTKTDSRYVRLDFQYSQGVDDMMVSNNSTFSDAGYRRVVKNMQWILSSESGEKTVYVRFRDARGELKTISQTITYTAPNRVIPDGSYVKGSASTVYYVGYAGRIHPIPNSAVYHTYRSGFADVIHVSDKKLEEYFIGGVVCIRPGTWLVKFPQSPRVYIPEPGCRLRPLRSPAEAFILYGESWNERIIGLPVHFQGNYTIMPLTEESRANDYDRDGLDKDTEDFYGSSARADDSDGDSLSDYEEIMYWFTDPKIKDTDGDGVSDGHEILLRRSPNGIGELTTIPEQTYTYPKGSVVYQWWKDKKYYYVHHNAGILFLGNNNRANAFNSNDFQSRFVITPPFEMSFTPRSGWYVLDDNEYIKDPLTTQYGSVVPM